MFETLNYFEMKGKIESIRDDGTGHARFFINAYINKRDVNILVNAFEVPSDIENGDTVVVKGYITVTPAEFRRPGMRYRQRFYAEEIKKDVTEMERIFGTEGKHHSADYFLAAFKGLIAGATKTNENWGKITIMVDNDNVQRYPSRIAMDYQIKGNRYITLPDFDFKAGDRIQVICSVTTSEKEYDGELIHFQNLKIEDIQRV